MKAMQPSVSNGLSTDTHKIVNPGIYSIYVETTVNEPSGLVITLSQSGSQSVTYVTPATSGQTNHVEMNGKFNCAVGDILTVAVTSSAPADQPPSLVKSVINLRQGV
jgi:hypothetical protein